MSRHRPFSAQSPRRVTSSLLIARRHHRPPQPAHELVQPTGAGASVRLHRSSFNNPPAPAAYRPQLPVTTTRVNHHARQCRLLACPSVARHGNNARPRRRRSHAVWRPPLRHAVGVRPPITHRHIDRLFYIPHAAHATFTKRTPSPVFTACKHQQRLIDRRRHQVAAVKVGYRRHHHHVDDAKIDAEPNADDAATSDSTACARRVAQNAIPRHQRKRRKCQKTFVAQSRRRRHADAANRATIDTPHAHHINAPPPIYRPIAVTRKRSSPSSPFHTSPRKGERKCRRIMCNKTGEEKDNATKIVRNVELTHIKRGVRPRTPASLLVDATYRVSVAPSVPEMRP